MSMAGVAVKTQCLVTPSAGSICYCLKAFRNVCKNEQKVHENCQNVLIHDISISYNTISISFLRFSKALWPIVTVTMTDQDTESLNKTLYFHNQAQKELIV